MAGAIVAAGALSLAATTTANAGAATGVVVSTSKTAKLGTFLVSGKSVYTLKANKNRCGTNCLKTWPPLVLPTGVIAATAGPGVNAAMLGTKPGPGGALQVTYGGKALYYFSGDKRSGQVTGNISDTWGKWSIVVTVKPAHAGSSSGSGNSSAGTGGASF
jgi:predicted lipoprotein with Yx(FWY)xxD motif